MLGVIALHFEYKMFIYGSWLPNWEPDACFLTPKTLVQELVTSGAGIIVTNQNTVTRFVELREEINKKKQKKSGH